MTAPLIVISDWALASSRTTAIEIAAAVASVLLVVPLMALVAVALWRGFTNRDQDPP
ncbi:MAG: hypothetical protein WEB00_15215 [Dehalococcoidia bacterium]